MFVPPPPPDPQEEKIRQAAASAAWSDPHAAETPRSVRPEPAPAYGAGNSRQILGIEGMSGKQLAAELERGGRFVVFQYCISLIFITFLRSSNIYFLRAGENGSQHSGGYSMLSAILGWWGIPWGPIYTIQALATNSKGGIDVTADVLASLGVSIEHQEQGRSRGRKRGRRRGSDDYGNGE
jgi:hypothetical protein